VPHPAFRNQTPMKRVMHKASFANSTPYARNPPNRVHAGFQKGGFLSWKIGTEPAKPLHEDQSDPGFLFINRTSREDLLPRDRRELRSHVMQRYVHQRKPKQERKEEAADENREGAQGRMELMPKVNKVLGGGRVDPFNSLPVTMSGSMSLLLDYCRCSSASSSPYLIPCFNELLTQLLCSRCYNSCPSTLPS
jgi:hypothetical protein